MPLTLSEKAKSVKPSSTLAITLIGGLVAMILIFLTWKGIALFTGNHYSLWEFLSGINWRPSDHIFGALPMIATSFSVTLLSGVIALPLALVVAIAITEILPSTAYKFFQLSYHEY